MTEPTTYVGWDMASAEGDMTVYVVNQLRDGVWHVIWSGSDGEYATTLASQLRNKRRAILRVIEGGNQ